MEVTNRAAPSLAAELAAVDVAAATVKMIMTNILLRTVPDGRGEVMKCFLQKLETFQAELKKCAKDKGAGGHQGPDCPKDTIPVGDFCVPRGDGG